MCLFVLQTYIDCMSPSKINRKRLSQQEELLLPYQQMTNSHMLLLIGCMVTELRVNSSEREKSKTKQTNLKFRDAIEMHSKNVAQLSSMGY